MYFNTGKINTKDLKELEEFNSFLSNRAFINGYLKFFLILF